MPFRYGPIIYLCWRLRIREGKQKQWLGLLSLLSSSEWVVISNIILKYYFHRVTPLFKHLQLSLILTISRVNKLCLTSTWSQNLVSLFPAVWFFNRFAACLVPSALAGSSPHSSPHLANSFLLQNLEVFSSRLFSKPSLLRTGSRLRLLHSALSNSSSPCQRLLRKSS